MTWRIRLSDHDATVPGWEFDSREEAQAYIDRRHLTMSPRQRLEDARWHDPVPFEESVNPDPCQHYSESGDEGPVRDLGRWPTRWRCDGCGRLRHEIPCLCDECKSGGIGEGSDA